MEWLENDVMLKVAGEAFRCECGCNVFRKHVATNRYKCNSCNAVYVADEPERVVA